MPADQTVRRGAQVSGGEGDTRLDTGVAQEPRPSGLWIPRPG